MGDLRIRELERAWRLSGLASDEAALVRERIRQGAVNEGDVFVAGSILPESEVVDLVNPQGGTATSEFTRRAACLYTIALGIRYAHDIGHLCRDWIDLTLPPGNWSVAWRAAVGDAGLGQRLRLVDPDPWPALFSPDPYWAQDAYLEFITRTDTAVKWNGGAIAYHEVVAERTRLMRLHLLPFALGHGLRPITELPGSAAVGSR